MTEFTFSSYKDLMFSESLKIGKKMSCVLLLCELTQTCVSEALYLIFRSFALFSRCKYLMYLTVTFS